MRHTISALVLLSLIWIINSGSFSPILLSLGSVSVLFVVWLSHRMDVVDNESQPIELTVKLPSYYLWLFVKIVRGNIDVVKHVWSPTLKISPCVATFSICHKNDMNRVIYANSITLTPGTIAIDLSDEWIIVHALTGQSLDEVKSGEMDNKVASLVK